MVILAIVAIIVTIIVSIITYNAGKRVPANIVKEHNDKILKEREQITAEIHQLKIRSKDIETDYQAKKQLIQDAKENAEREYKQQKSIYDNQLIHQKQKLREEYEYDSSILQEQIDIVRQELDSLRNTKAATIEALQKEKLIQENKDDYRIKIAANDRHDIDIISSIKNQLSKPRILSMLIWSTFWQKSSKAKIAEIFGIEPVCGIYKITSLIDERCYIGQAVKIQERITQHLKHACDIDCPANNKLYEAMKEQGIENFTIELLEECPREKLNEKERYYIELYNSYNFGFNSTQGNR